MGFGHIGRRHAQMISQRNDATLLGIADIDGQLEREVEKLRVPFFNSLTALLSSVQHIDVVCICTPNGLHVPMALEALNHGCHVVMEKPMGLTTASCEKVVAAAAKMNKEIFCVMQNRYSPPSKWLKQMVEEGKLGRIFMVQVNCFWNRDDRYYKQASSTNLLPWRGTLELDGGPLFTQFSHFIDLLFWLFGDISNVTARFENYNHRQNTEFKDDSGIICFDFKKGGTGSFSYSTSVWNLNLESSITIIGEEGTIKVGGQYMEQIIYCHVHNYEMPQLAPANPPNDYGAYKGSAANHHFVFQNVVETLQGKSKNNTSGFEGLKVVEMIEQMYASLQAKNRNR